MSAIYLLIGFSLVIAIIFLVAFLWASRSGQYDDDYTPSVRMIFDDAVSTEGDSISNEPNPITPKEQ